MFHGSICHCSHGYAFYAAAYLKGDLTTFFDLIEDVVAQADEIDDKFLQVSRLGVVTKYSVKVSH